MAAAVWKAPRDEAEAARILEAGGRFTRMVIGLRAGIALARDPDDTEQVFLLARTLDGDSLPRMRRKLEGIAGGEALLRDRPAIDRASVDFDALRALAPDTLGGAYVRMMDANGLSPDIFQSPPGIEPDLAFIGQRIRQTHDLWHVVTGLSTDIPGEVALQAFSHAQLGQRFSLAITAIGLLVFGLRYPRMFGLARRWHRAGRRMPYLLAVRWEELWQRPLSEVRASLGLPAAAR